MMYKESMKTAIPIYVCQNSTDRNKYMYYVEHGKN